MRKLTFLSLKSPLFAFLLIASLMRKDCSPMSRKNQPLYAFLLIASLMSYSLEAQVLNPLKWQTSHTANKAKVGDVVELVFTANVEKDWYLYSTDFDPNLGPMVTVFSFRANDTYKLVGKIVPQKPKKKYDELWGGEYTYFVGKGEFRQKIEILKSKVKIEASVACQACTEADGKCVPLEEEFSFAFTAEETEKSKAESKTENTQNTEQTNLPANDSLKNNDSSGVKTEETNKPNTTKTDADYQMDLGEESILGFMLLAFLGGLTAIITPCVFPMIPMTVSFFTSRSGTRAQAIFQASLYGFSIILIYTLVGVFVSYFFGEDAANFIATHWIPNVAFFLIFVIFAISFFGAFEIMLPNDLVNSIDQKADKGGLIGVFFMALTLVVVSFSCTGPIAGTILVESARGNFLKPAAGMFAFSSAFALPFTLFAMFPSWLSKMPKSGGWLNTVKVVLGFIELALAFKFLSVADQVFHWGILDRDIYITIWIAIAISMGMYLLGVYRLPHDSPMDKVGVPRFLMALVSFTFALYLLPGLIGAPLKALSGYLPPASTHDFDIFQMVSQGGGTHTTSGKTSDKKIVKYGDFLHLPHNIEGYFEFEEALAASKKENKPIFVDFTGHGCVNCREMEAYVWSKPNILAMLKEKFIVVALYVDEPKELPESEWITSKYDGKIKKTIGKINADIQKTRYNNNAQPFYVLLDTEGNLLTKPTAYNSDVAQFENFLTEGLKEFEARK